MPFRDLEPGFVAPSIGLRFAHLYVGPRMTFIPAT